MMSLLNKISIWFIVIMLLVTPVTMYISYSNIKKRIDTAEIERLKSLNETAAAQLRKGEMPQQTIQGKPITVNRYDSATLPAQNPEIIHVCGESAGLKQNECLVQVNSFVHTGNGNYKISAYNYVTQTDDIIKGMLNAVIWKMLFIILAVAITARILSRYILQSFRHTTNAIRHFNLQQKEKLQLAPTTTREFKELNEFLQAMTNKAVQDYASVKEFSENASHELQTPLAVIQSKIELLAETGIDGNQAALIADMQNAIDKLGRINRSLVLLTRLDNHEFKTDEPVRFCTVTKDAIAAYSDRITMKNLSITTSVDKDVKVKIHKTLAEILVNNLFTNAIRHNITGGSVDVLLTQRYLQINNTGTEPEMPAEELFRRFKKSNQCADSIGLGLSIVQQICEVSNFSVHYDFTGGWHSITVYFQKNEKHHPFVPLQNYFKM